MRTWGLCALAALALTAVPAAGSPSGSSVKLASRLAGVSASARGVRVIIEAKPGRAAAAVSAAVRSGATLEAVYHDVVQVLAPASSLDRLAASPAVSFVRPPLIHVPDAITGQEVGASGTLALRSAGLTGLGVKIAIIDVGFAGEKAAEASGELPDQTILKANWCSDLTVSSHGTAVAEIVHGMPPQARRDMRCIDSEMNLAQASDWAISQGITLINHSVTWVSGGRGDGVHNRIDRVSPDDVAHRAFNSGALWVNAAGNFGQSHWSGNFSDPDGNRWENFSGTDEGNDFTVPPRSTACVSLVWDQWLQTDQDFNVYMYRKSGPHNPEGQIALASGEDQQRPGHQGTPSEEACYENKSDSALTAYVAIKNIQASTAPRFDLFVTQGNLQYSVPQGSVAQPAESPWVLAVGAVCWDRYGFRPYSSQGPTIDGRTKPNIVGYDSVSTQTFGSGTGCNNGFMGTSAATPAPPSRG